MLYEVITGQHEEPAEISACLVLQAFLPAANVGEETGIQGKDTGAGGGHARGGAARGGGARRRRAGA